MKASKSSNFKIKSPIVEASSSAYGAFSLGRLNGKIVLIKGVIPGERVEVIIKEKRKDFYIADVSKVLESSPDRINPPCEYFGVCGGCQLQYINYKRQIKIKEEILQDCLRRIGKIEIELSEPLFHEDPWNYRHRGQFKVSNSHIGFYKEKSRDVVDIKKCLIMKEEINNFLSQSRDILLKYPLLKEINITYGNSAVALIKIKKDFSEKIAYKFLEYGFSGIIIDTVKGISEFGEEFTTFDLDDLRYTLSPMSFLQSHWRLNKKVVSFIRDNLKPYKLRILDLYAGAGNFSIPLYREAKEILGIEENPFAVKDGKRNLLINGIKNYRFILTSVEKYDFKDAFDILIIDPPRIGLSNRVISKILNILNPPERIVYISCNPTTLSRDLRKLSLKYKVDSVRLIDFFPQTYHIESIAFLRPR